MAAQEIRIAIDIEQKAEKGVPITMELRDGDGELVNIFTELESTTPAEQPVTIGGDQQRRIFIADGGDFKARFWWTATDDKERDFEEEFTIPVPPLCPKCEERVQELVDYLCESCRGYS